jgi:uncharacterized protein
VSDLTPPERRPAASAGTPPAGATAAPRGRGYYQLIQGGDGAFRFTLRAGNHETILESVVFWSRQSALAGVDALRVVAQESAQYRSVTEEDGRLRFEITDTEGRLLASSAPYSTRSGLTAGMASVRRHSASPAFRGLVFRTTVAS